MMRKLTGDKPCIEWHKKYLTRKFTAWELVMAFLTLNIISRQFGKVFKKLGIAVD